MTSLQKKGFVLVVLLQLSVLGMMVFEQKYTRRTGTTILLECIPVDPRSLFSGDYVVLNYKLNNPSTSRDWYALNKGQHSFHQQQIIYVALQKSKENEFWEPIEIAPSLEALNYPVILSGEIEDLERELIRFEGIQNYFVPQFKGLDIERFRGVISVEIAVTASGKGAIKRLFLDGNEVQFDEE